MVTIWFEPHSTSIDNEAKLSSGWNDVDLSEAGYKQAIELVDRNLHRGIYAIFSSDLQRAIKTARPLAAETGLPLYVDTRLRECDYGELTQKPKNEVDALKVSKVSEPFPGGECYLDCMERMNNFLDYLRESFDGKTVLIIGHRATQYALESRLLKKPLAEVVAAPWSWQPGWKYELS